MVPGHVFRTILRHGILAGDLSWCKLMTVFATLLHSLGIGGYQTATLADRTIRVTQYLSLSITCPTSDVFPLGQKCELYRFSISRKGEALSETFVVSKTYYRLFLFGLQLCL